MASTAETATEYFEAVGRQDLETMTATWQPGGKSRIIGLVDLEAPAGVSDWFGTLFRAMPDLAMKVENMVTEGNQAAVLWAATATFDGTGEFEGFKPNGARISIEGMDIVEIEDGRIQSLVAIINGLDLARQIGAVPAQGSPADKGLAAAFNAKTAVSAQARKLLEKYR